MIISKTPLRMSFFGGGTDFADYYKNSRYGYGTVISTALDMYVYIMVCKRFDDKIRVCYTVNEFVDSVDQIKHNIIREALKMLGIEKGIDIPYRVYDRENTYNNVGNLRQVSDWLLPVRLR